MGCSGKNNLFKFGHLINFWEKFWQSLFNYREWRLEQSVETTMLVPLVVIWLTSNVLESFKKRSFSDSCADSHVIFFSGRQLRQFVEFYINPWLKYNIISNKIETLNKYFLRIFFICFNADLFYRFTQHLPTLRHIDEYI